MQILKNVTVVIASVALAASLSPMPALARSLALAETTSGRVLTQSSGAKTVYVVSAVDSNVGTSTFSYGKSGLLEERTYHRLGSTVIGVKKVTKWSYDGKRRIKAVKETSTYDTRGLTAVCKYTTNPKGVITEERYSEKSAWGLAFGRAGSKATVGYTVSNGRIVNNEQTAQTGSSARIASKTLAYKNGRVSSYAFGTDSTKVPLAYDKHGNLKRDGKGGRRAAGPFKGAFKNSYSPSGLLASTVMKYRGIDSSVTYRYTYKPIKVKRSNLAKVNEQQWAIKNGNLNFALGGYMLPGASIGVDNVNLILSLNM